MPVQKQRQLTRSRGRGSWKISERGREFTEPLLNSHSQLGVVSSLASWQRAAGDGGGEARQVLGNIAQLSHHRAQHGNLGLQCLGNMKDSLGIIPWVRRVGQLVEKRLKKRGAHLSVHQTLKISSKGSSMHSHCHVVWSGCACRGVRGRRAVLEEVVA